MSSAFRTRSGEAMCFCIRKACLRRLAQVDTLDWCDQNNQPRGRDSFVRRAGGGGSNGQHKFPAASCVQSFFPKRMIPCIPGLLAQRLVFAVPYL